MDIKSKYIIQKLISKGILASINQALDLEAAKEVCAEFGFRADVISFEQEAEAKQEVADKPEDHVITTSRCHHHGPCRSWQNIAARCDPRNQCNRHRSRRNHAAYRRLSGGYPRTKHCLSSTLRVTKPSP